MQKHSTQTVNAALETLAKAANAVGSLFPDRRTSGTGLDKTRPNPDAERTLSGKDKASSAVPTTRKDEDSVADAEIYNPGETLYKLAMKQDDHGQYEAAHASCEERVKATIARMATKPHGDALDDGDNDDEEKIATHCSKSVDHMDAAMMAQGDERRGHLVRALGHMAHACRLHEAMSKKK